MDGLFLVAFVLLMPVLVAAYVQQFFVLPRLSREIELLNMRRAKRVEQALAVTSTSDWEEVAQNPKYAFSSWVEFLEDGTVMVASQNFSLHRAFQVVARDQRHISRATVICQGNGEALITSHGQLHSVRFSENKWHVQLLENPTE